MSKDTTSSCHQRPTTWTQTDFLMGGLVWLFIILATYAWTERATLIAWFSMLR